MPGVAFPPGGPLGLGSPPSQVLCSAKTTSLPVSGRFACRSLPDTLRASVRLWCPLRARVLVEAPRSTPGPVVNRSPGPVMAPGDGWRSHVPELPLEMPAPLSDPGGVRGTRPDAPRTAAFRSTDGVGVPLPTACKVILAVHNYTHFGAQ